MERDFQAAVELFRDRARKTRADMEELWNVIASPKSEDITFTDLFTMMIIQHIELGGHAGQFYGNDLWAMERFGRRIRNAIELEFVQAADQEKSPLLLDFVFAAMEEVDWRDVAISTRDMIIEEQQRIHELARTDSPVKPLLTSYEVDGEKMEELLKKVRERKP